MQWDLWKISHRILITKIVSHSQHSDDDIKDFIKNFSFFDRFVTIGAFCRITHSLKIPSACFIIYNGMQCIYRSLCFSNHSTYLSIFRAEIVHQKNVIKTCIFAYLYIRYSFFGYFYQVFWKPLKAIFSICEQYLWQNPLPCFQPHPRTSSIYNYLLLFFTIQTSKNLLILLFLRRSKKQRQNIDNKKTFFRKIEHNDEIFIVLPSPQSRQTQIIYFFYDICCFFDFILTIYLLFGCVFLCFFN